MSSQRRPAVLSVEFRVGNRGVDERTHTREWHHHRPTFKITKGTVIREWLTTLFSWALLSFYSFALISSPEGDKNKSNYKLLAGYVIMSAYMRLCYTLQTLSKTFVLYQRGEVEVQEIPMQTQIGIFSCLMCLVEPGHFICLCWITHVAFPLRPCADLEYWATCTSLHISSSVFVSLWILTFLAVFIFFGVFFTGQRFRMRNLQSTLSLAPMPDGVRSTIIENLPLSDDPPPEGEVCAFCLERDGTDQWRVLPCGHRFHAKCVDDWLLHHRGTCPICRHNPVSAVQNEQQGAGDAIAAAPGAASTAAGSGAREAEMAPVSAEGHVPAGGETREVVAGGAAGGGEVAGALDSVVVVREADGRAADAALGTVSEGAVPEHGAAVEECRADSADFPVLVDEVDGGEHVGTADTAEEMADQEREEARGGVSAAGPHDSSDMSPGVAAAARLDA